MQDPKAAPTLPAHVARPRASRERLAVEAALAMASPAAPMSMRDIAQRAGLAISTVQPIVGSLVYHNMAHPVNPGKKPRKYAPGSGVAQEVASRPTWMGVDDYDGAELRPNCVRAGAMRAFTLPSLSGGRLIERRVPTSLASRIPDRTTK